jgi:arginine decarboxylase
VARLRRASEEALRKGLLTFEESALLIRRYEEGLSGYTYLEEEEPFPPLSNGSNGLAAKHTSAAASPGTAAPPPTTIPAGATAR